LPKSPDRFVRRFRGSVLLGVAGDAGEVDRDARFVADRPRVVAGRDDGRVAGADVGLGAVVPLGLRPLPQEWVAFRRALDDIGVWEWAESSCDPGVMDGTNWSFTAGYADRRVESKGSNAYPPRFAEWLRAVSALSGDATFR
jgi:hypothetical protein